MRQGQEVVLTGLKAAALVGVVNVIETIVTEKSIVQSIIVIENQVFFFTRYFLRAREALVLTYRELIAITQTLLTSETI